MKSPFFKTSHDNKDTNKSDSNSFKGEKEGGNNYCGRNCDNSSVLHANTTENGEKILKNIPVYNSSKMKLSNTSGDKTIDTGSTSNGVMSSVSEHITEIIDKPADIIGKKSECKPLSKSDSGFSEKNVSTMNGKETSENTITSDILSSGAAVTSDECEEGKYDSAEDDNETKVVKEMSIDQAHKLFDRRYAAQMALGSIPSDLKVEFEEAGVTSPLERSIKKLRRTNSVNKKDNKKVSTWVENSEDITDDDYEDESYSDENDEISQGI